MSWSISEEMNSHGKISVPFWRASIAFPDSLSTLCPFLTAASAGFTEKSRVSEPTEAEKDTNGQHHT
ncbi:MAG: hypothetical protein MZU91_00525 [Desulfosudis oleivorans]|nr:hypothetical protein [Desulfosudis oleivorans]